jgi:hypothetical protein
MNAGYEISQNDFIKGLTLLRAAVDLEKLLGPSYYLTALLLLPWTHDNFIIYPDGGLLSCGENSAAAWQDAWDYLTGQGVRLNGNSGRSILNEDCLIHPDFFILGEILLKQGIINVPVMMNVETGELVVKRIEYLNYGRK